jgi:predicted aconitase with swiveling domain
MAFDAARVLLPGEAHGPALVLRQPLSLWGGLDPRTGEITDVRHPECGQLATERVLFMPSARGSSSSSSVLAEAVRRRTAPSAIILGEPDGILLVGALVAQALYGRIVPIVVAPPVRWASVRTGAGAHVAVDGRVACHPAGAPEDDDLRA